MNDAVQIRVAQRSDVEDVVEMSHAVGDHEGMPASKFDAASFLSFGFGRRQLFHCYVADCGERLVGHVCATRSFDFQEGCPAFWIADLYVDPRYRRRGIARSLIAAIATQALHSKPSLVQWLIAPDNKLARDFYRSLGAHYDSGHAMYLGAKEIEALESLDR